MRVRSEAVVGKVVKPTNRAPWTIWNKQAYALGTTDYNGRFHVRRVVWGRVMARYEKRDGERIVKVELSIVD